MKELSELIREYPELGDRMAEFENRISYLEQSMPSTRRMKLEPEPRFDDIYRQGLNNMEEQESIEIKNRLTGLENYLTQKQPPRKTKYD